MFFCICYFYGLKWYVEFEIILHGVVEKDEKHFNPFVDLMLGGAK
jgi:hypothetical protein